MKNKLKLLFIVFTIISFAITSYSQNSVNPQLFKSQMISNVIKSDSIDLDQLKQLIIIPGGAKFRKYFETINYFTEAKTIEQFEKEIKSSDQKDLIGDIQKGNGIFDAYDKYKKYLILFISEEKGNVVKISLYKPDIKDDIFIVENKSKTIVIGIQAGQRITTDEAYNSMMNEVVNYIRKNSKSYNR